MKKSKEYESRFKEAKMTEEQVRYYDRRKSM
jgi:hypothetical protein